MMEDSLGNEEEKLKNDEQEEEIPKRKFQIKLWQKLLILASIISIWIVVVIIELIITFGRDEKKSEINCIYSILDIGENISILGKDFDFNSISKMIIDDIKEISSPIKEYNFTTIGNHSIKYVINDTLNMDNMYKDVKNLISIKMMSEKSRKITSMESTFENCEMLNEFNIIGFDTKNIKSMRKLFSNCKLSIDSNIFKNISTQNVDDFSYMFSKKGFHELNLELDTKNAKNLSHMFEDCSSLKSLKLNIDTNNVIDMSYMFHSCTSLKSLDITKFNTKKVKNMSSMFYRCFILEKLDVSKFDTNEVEDMSSMFNVVSMITSLNVSNFITSKVKNMSSMFRYLENLNSLDISNFETKNVEDLSSMFSFSIKIKKLDLSNFNTNNVKNMEWMFANMDRKNKIISIQY